MRSTHLQDTLESSALWHYRLYLLLGGVLYSAWVPLEIWVNHNDVHYLDRGIITGLYVLIAIFSFKSDWIKKNLEQITFLAFIAMLTEYFFEIYRNQANIAVIEGFHIISVGSIICIRRLSFLAVYYIFSLIGLSLTYTLMPHPELNQFHVLSAFSTISIANFVAIFARQKLETQLHDEHRNFQFLFDNSHEGLAVVDQENKIIQANQIFFDIFESAQLGMKMSSLISMQDAQEYDTKTQLEESSSRLIHVRRRSINFNGASCAIYGLEDVTQKRKSEMTLHSNAKMFALGEMASGIAHEINNPLAIISANAALLKRLPLPEDQKTKLLRSTNIISSTVDRIAKIIQGLRKFSRNASQDPFEVKNIGHLIQEVIDFSEMGGSSPIEFKIEIPDDLSLECQAIELQQALINLITNSVYALEHSHESHPWIKIQVEALGDAHLQIVVIDNGPGVPAEYQAKLTQPFFTTKPPGQGTGLGLSIARGIVEAHQGRLYYLPFEEHEYRSNRIEDGRGARFIIELPRTQAKPILESKQSGIAA